MRKQNADLSLAQCWLYAVSSPADLAGRLSPPKNKITVDQLRSLSQDAGNFRLFKIVNEKGKVREIQWPKPALQRIHTRVHTLLSRVAAPDYLYSAIKGRSYVSNAAAHDPAVPTVKIDIQKFFPSVSRAAIFNFFQGPLRCRRDVAGLIADLLTFDSHLATGSAASPIIAYYSHKAMFDEIDAFANSQGLKMTCYVDDMALSGPRATKATLHAVKQIISSHGLKSHKAHTFSAAQPKIITGVCNTKTGPEVPNKLHLKIKNGFDEWRNAKSETARQKALSPLLGRLEAAAQIDTKFKERAKTLRRHASIISGSKA